MKWCVETHELERRWLKIWLIREWKVAFMMAQTNMSINSNRDFNSNVYVSLCLIFNQSIKSFLHKVVSTGFFLYLNNVKHFLFFDNSLLYKWFSNENFYCHFYWRNRLFFCYRILLTRPVNIISFALLLLLRTCGTANCQKC